PAVAHVLEALTDEMTARYRRRGGHTPLTVVIDEVPSITLHCKRGWETHYPQLVFEGRKVALRTFILTQSAQVKPLGLEGKGDLRESLLFVYLGAFAVEHCPASAAQRFPAAIEWWGQVRAIDTTPLPAYARLPVPEQARWEPPMSADTPVPLAADNDDGDTPSGWFDALCGPGSTAGTDAETGDVGTGSAPGSGPGSVNPADPDGISEEAALVWMMRRGASINHLLSVIGGNKQAAREYLRQLATKHNLPEKYR
ncbi:MAG: hypothetical protein HC914_21305, partial [Chloroflexaceae bacterium]|nr:hypothetical protein [Chloroflexaceae bacterium]